MKRRNPILVIASLVAASMVIGNLSAREYGWQVVKNELNYPMGIASVWTDLLVFTEVPTPGEGGGDNAVKLLDLTTGKVSTLSMGEPEPVNVAADRWGNLYWTCRTAGVILKYSADEGKQLFLDTLMSPTGIDVDENGDVLFTEVPMPGASGSNMVSASDGDNVTMISMSEPEPADIVVGPDNTSYWTCTTAGVIVRRSPAGVISVLLDGLASPMGIALNRDGTRLFFTEVPTPGVNGTNGGSNTVKEYDLMTGETSLVADGFPYPADITVSSNNLVYWTCKTAGVIVRGYVKK